MGVFILIAPAGLIAVGIVSVMAFAYVIWGVRTSFAIGVIPVVGCTDLLDRLLARWISASACISACVASG